MIKKSFKIFKLVFGLLALSTLLFTNSQPEKVQQHQTKISPKKKEQLASLNTQTKNDNNFLFVDCTGFFE